ncbi:MAG: thioredoxin domain-containing protein [Bacteroidota bacterium]|nr:thioredoxin domain-containing protein [Bacteroidota bacterium]
MPSNQLIHSLSPYLLQHAQNPVDWYEWGEEAFNKAKNENKLLLISIGYSACHWCHVMAHESFEDQATAELMNRYFVCVKVDREELPNVDQFYMDACQLVNGSGGWPLNAFALPDQRPIHALTYLPKDKWQKLMTQINDLWQNKPETALEYAEKLGKGLKNMNIPPEISFKTNLNKTSELAFENFVSQYDSVYGGMQRAPKFPMPNNLAFLLNYAQLNSSDAAINMALHTMKQMSLGGIYDIVEGGFCRYSVDIKWFAPHFEKMLYDNAQLIGVYSYAYAISQNPFFKQIALQCIAFCNNEWRDKNGVYCSALDADSEGEEGLYYVYTYDELIHVLGLENDLFIQYFQCTQTGNWEHGKNILFALNTIDEAAIELKSDKAILKLNIEIGIEKLKKYRSTRIKPGLDDKKICSWNGLMLKGLAEAARFLEDQSLKLQIENLSNNILKTFYKDGQLYRIENKGQLKISAFLEDFANVIDGLITAYQVLLDENLLIKAKELCDQTIKLFFNEEKHFFKFSIEDGLAIEKYDVADDVINSGNSVMAHNLWRLSWYFDHRIWQDIVKNMISAMIPLVEKSAPWYANWATLNLQIEKGMNQYIVSAKNKNLAELAFKKINLEPNAILGYVNQDSNIPLFQQKLFKNKNLIYTCRDFTCLAPEEIQ